MLLVVVDPVAGEVDVVTGVVEEAGEAAGQLPRGVDHEVDDAVVTVLQKARQDPRLLDVGFEEVYAGNRLFRVDQGDRVHLIAHRGKAGNQILPHRAGGAENENFFRMIHLLSPQKRIEPRRLPCGWNSGSFFKIAAEAVFSNPPGGFFCKRVCKEPGGFEKTEPFMQMNQARFRGRCRAVRGCARRRWCSPRR